MLLGHLHTHEFACGGTTDQVGNPWALERSAGGSSGGSGGGTRLAAGARGDRHRHRRLAAHPLGRVRDVDDQADARARSRCAGSCPLAPTFDHPGPMTRSGARLRAAARGAGRRPAARRSAGRSAATPSRRGSPTSTRTSPTASSARSQRFPGERVEPPPPAARLDVLGEFFDIVLTEMLVWHRRFEDRWGEYRYSNRARLEHAAERGDDRGGVRRRPGPPRRRTPDAWLDWFAEHRVDAVVEPTLPIVAPVRGQRLRRAVRRPRRPLADVLLGLDGLPGRLAAVRRRVAAAACP